MRTLLQADTRSLAPNLRLTRRSMIAPRRARSLARFDVHEPAGEHARRNFTGRIGVGGLHRRAMSLLFDRWTTDTADRRERGGARYRDDLDHVSRWAGAGEYTTAEVAPDHWPFLAISGRHRIRGRAVARPA